MKKIFSLILLAVLLLGCTINDLPEDAIEEKPEPTVKEDIRINFLAVGDNLIHGAIYNEPSFIANGYDFTPIYSEVKGRIQAADIAYINQETMLGGRELGLESYPMFNSPQEIGDAVIDAGFDWVNHATNHTLDVGETGVIKTLEYWDDKANIQVTGIARNNEEANTSRIIDKDGVRIGLIAYTYGTNGIPVPSGKDYLVNLIDKERMQKDIENLKGKTDSIAVSLHWGIEYSFTESEEQADIAQFLADLGVDVIIGTHPHVIQPIKRVTGKDGNETLVIYSLGNFLSAQDQNYRMLGGIASWDLVFNPNDKTTKIEAVSFEPTINYYSSAFQKFKIYPIKDYTDEIARTHGLAASQNMSKQYFIDIVDKVMGDDVEIIY